MSPVVTTFIGYLLIDETVNLYQVIGACILILGGVYVILLKDKPNQLELQRYAVSFWYRWHFSAKFCFVIEIMLERNCISSKKGFATYVTNL